MALGAPAPVGDSHIWQALRHAEAADFIAQLPEGLDTTLGEQWGGQGLSGGQWQRLALARICLRNAGIWILDEPTSALDAETEREVFAHLAASKRERITIVVSHRASTLRDMDRIVVFDRGRVVQEGGYSQLLAAPGVFRQMFRTEVRSKPQ